MGVGKSMVFPEWILHWWDPISPICITNQCITKHVQHLCDTFAMIWDDLHSRMTKDDKRWHFVTICNVLYHSTVLPFTSATFSDTFRPFATFLDFALFNTPPVWVAFSGTFHQTLFTWLVHHSFGFSRYYIGPIGLALYWCFELHSIIIAVLMFLVTTTTK